MTDLAQEKLRQAKELKRAFRIGEAFELFNEAAQIEPSGITAWAQGGLCLLISGDPQEAAVFLSNAFNNSGFQDITVGAYLAAALTAAARENEARTARRQCLEHDKEADFAEPYMLVAEMMAEKKKYEEALRLLDVLSAEFAKSDWFKTPRNHYRLICVLADAGAIDVARVLAQSLSECAGWYGSAAQAAVLQAEGDRQAAYDMMTQAVKNGAADDPLALLRYHWLALNK